MGTTNSIQKNFTHQKISHTFNPPQKHEKMHKNWLVHQKNIDNAKKKWMISQLFLSKLLKASAIGLRYIWSWWQISFRFWRNHMENKILKSILRSAYCTTKQHRILYCRTPSFINSIWKKKFTLTKIQSSSSLDWRHYVSLHFGGQIENHFMFEGFQGGGALIGLPWCRETQVTRTPVRLIFQFGCVRMFFDPQSC